MPALDHTLETARTIEDHAIRCGREPLSKAHNLEMLLLDLIAYAHKEGIDFDEALDDARTVAYVHIPRPIRAPAGRHTARQPWPKFEGGRTLEKYAQDMLRSGRRCPFDAFDSEVEGEDGALPEPGDWALRAARGIIADFDDRGAEMNEAFHPEKVAEEDLIEIVDVMAAIMREAPRLHAMNDAAIASRSLPGNAAFSLTECRFLEPSAISTVAIFGSRATIIVVGAHDRR